MTSDIQTEILIALAYGVLIAFAVQIVFLRFLQVTLQRCAPQNRAISPGQVWLNLIPFFNLVWQFMLVTRIAETLRREFAARRIPPVGDFGKGVGVALGCLVLASVIPFVGILTSLAAFICWIIYWVKIAGYSRMLASDGPSLGGAYSTGAPPFPESPAEPEAERPASETGWIILAILALGFGASYLQRSAMSLVIFDVRRDLQLSTAEIGWILSAVMYGLMAGYILMTVVTALAGTRWGLLVSLLGATVAGASAGLASGFTGLIVARLLLGVFSGGLLPAAVQAVREWFPSRMRTLAIALVFAAGQLAAFLSQVLFTETTIGWRTMTFVSGLPTAIAAILCILLWPARTPREPSRRVSGRAILWAAMLAVGLLLVAPVFQFVTVRLPSFSRQRLGIDAVDMKTAAAVPLLASLCGAVLAGALAWAMMSNGGRTARTRAVLLTVSGILLLPVAVTGYISQWPFILVLMAVCSMAFGAWSTLLYAAVADTLPARGVAIAAAIGGLMGTVSGLLVSTILNHASAAGIEILPFGMAATAAVALLAVALPAWLIRPEPD